MDREQTLAVVKNYLELLCSSDNAVLKDGLPQHKKQKVAQPAVAPAYNIEKVNMARIVVPRQHNDYDCALCVASMMCKRFTPNLLSCCGCCPQVHASVHSEDSNGRGGSASLPARRCPMERPREEGPQI